jgi:Flp pilus assembly protein TadD
VAVTLLAAWLSSWVCPEQSLAKKHSHKAQATTQATDSQSAPAGKHRQSGTGGSPAQGKHSGKKGSVAAGVSSKSKGHRRHGKVAEEPKSKGKSSKSKISARHKSAGPGQVGGENDANEPKAMPPNYEAETRLLSKSYKLRDQALNEQMRGDLGEAVRHLREATEISGEYYQGERSPTEATLYYDLAVAAEAAGQTDLAVQSYRQCIERNAKMPGVRVKLALLLAKQGETEEAMGEARKAADSDPEDPRPHHLMGLLLERKGDIVGARQEQDRSKALLDAKPVRHRETVREQGTEKQGAPVSEEKSDESKEPELDNPPADMPLGLP